MLRAAGVLAVGDGSLIGNAGTIRSRNAASAAVEMNVVERDGLPAADTSARLENSGLISASDVAVLGGPGKETVVNSGRIVGDVSLGDGDDAFTFARGGAVNGEVALGDGNDRVLVENGSGVSRVSDFTAGDTTDTVDVSAFHSDFDQVRANARQQGC